ncbi:ribosomal protein L5 (plastid) [Cryptomonas paramecium]|uniref:Ribosomal protein L5 n=1 Tax=Cryptomonas paramaecium TaxID=2898 RepID=D2ISA6_9CRYP|nr:ribosomal protein L5 [Cryptomonas paramecium]ACT46798.1 ribosomal protein L5 [Cryptomonas paramecium]BDA97997.1 ribosomal protein L5 [Cryptomonas paramecium]
MTENLRNYYKQHVIQELTSLFKYKNPHQVPKLIKITLNRGLGEASKNNKSLDTSVHEFELITGQHPVITKAKKSVAGFKIREGMPVGIMVTLRKELMFSFLQRLIHLALPRIRDFKGVSITGFDGHGNYNFGIKEQLIFPEIDYDKVDHTRGLNISIVTTASTQQEGAMLLKCLGMPFNDL